jgi:hypothetical protein
MNEPKFQNAKEKEKKKKKAHDCIVNPSQTNKNKQ